MYITLEPRLDTAPEASATNCPPSTPGCPSLPPTPASTITNTTYTASTTTLTPTPTPTPTITPTAIPDVALATDIQSFGHRNFVGLLVLALLAFLGLVLWLAFGQLPRRAFRRLRARFGGGDRGIGNEEGGGDEDGKAGHGPSHEDRERAREGGKVVRAVETRAGMGVGAPGSPGSVELDVNTLEKNDRVGAFEQRTTPPRVRFA